MMNSMTPSYNKNINNNYKKEPIISQNKIDINLFQRNNDYIPNKNNYNYNSNIPSNINNINNDYINVQENASLNTNNNNNINIQTIQNYSTPVLKQDPNNINTQNQTRLNTNEIYLSEIDNLKKELFDLKKNNEYLNIQLKKEQTKNKQLITIQKSKNENENSILAEISHCLQVSTPEEILPKLNEIINYLNNSVDESGQKNSKIDKNNKMKDELISTLNDTYISLSGSKERKEDINIKTLWKWIKQLINTVKQLALEKERIISISENIQGIIEYKKFCEELINFFKLQNLDELKIFMDGILKDNNIYEQNEVDDAVMDNNNMEQNFQNEENGDIEGEEGINEEDDNDYEENNNNNN